MPVLTAEFAKMKADKSLMFQTFTKDSQLPSPFRRRPMLT